MSVYSPPEYPSLKGKVSIFLAGSIEMGNAEEWQSSFIRSFGKRATETANHIDWVILNPRRPNWDSSLKQEISNAQFYQQVDWELTYLERANHKVFYFAADTLSPVSLLELGKFGGEGNVYVLANERYLRKGNVDIFCHRYRIPVYRNIPDIINRIIISSL